MIDTNIFDKMIADEYFPEIWQAVSSGMVKLLTCEIQEEEISRIQNPRKLQLIQSIPRQVVPQVSLDDPGDDLGSDLRIAHTAAKCADAFVTEDKKLQEWYQEHYPNHPCLNYQDFLILILRSV
ncbi:MAG TPA: hypothetical protein GX019_03920 [Firmicutes bacterium]|nr:hypothetical protein [Bacillota bacterium]